MCLVAEAKRKSRNGKHQTGSKWCRKSTRLAIYLRDGFTCMLCGVDLHDSPRSGITLDHIVPRSKGGSNRSDNLVTACIRCNCSKQDKDLAEFVSDVSTRRRIRRRADRDLTPYRKIAIAIIKDAINQVWS